MCGRHILLVSPACFQASGNYTTMERLRLNLTKNKSCSIGSLDHCSVSSFKSKLDLQTYVTQKRIDCLLALHAAHCANLLEDIGIPFILIFGGTDLNEHSKNELVLNSMTNVVFGATAIVCFGKSMKTKAMNLWPDLNSELLFTIPQAVSTSPSNFDLRLYLKKQFDLDVADIYLLVANIRPVKDPLFLVEEFSRWHKNGHRSSYFIIIGSKIEDEFYGTVKKHVEKFPGTLLLQSIPYCDIQSAIQQSCALVNSSVSEGMASSILEAMDLGTPVVVRDIPGNTDIVEHLQTGFVFDTPKVFIELIEMLKADELLRLSVTKNGKMQAKTNHSCTKESMAYQHLIEKTSNPKNS